MSPPTRHDGLSSPGAGVQSCIRGLALVLLPAPLVRRSSSRLFGLGVGCQEQTAPGERPPRQRAPRGRRGAGVAVAAVNKALGLGVFLSVFPCVYGLARPTPRLDLLPRCWSCLELRCRLRPSGSSCGRARAALPCAGAGTTRPRAFPGGLRGQTVGTMQRGAAARGTGWGKLGGSRCPRPQRGSDPGTPAARCGRWPVEALGEEEPRCDGRCRGLDLSPARSPAPAEVPGGRVEQPPPRPAPVSCGSGSARGGRAGGGAAGRARPGLVPPAASPSRRGSSCPGRGRRSPRGAAALTGGAAVAVAAATGTLRRK